MTNIKIAIAGYKATHAILSGIHENMDQATYDVLEKIGQDIVQEAKSNLQNNANISTGSLLGSIEVKQITGDSLTVGSDLPYAGIIEFGRGPVTPKSVEFLSWIDKTTGKRVFSKYSKAVEPHPYLEPAVQTALKGLSGIYSEKIGKSLKVSSDSFEQV